MGCSSPCRCHGGVETGQDPPGCDGDSQVGAAASAITPLAMGRPSRAGVSVVVHGTKGHRWDPVVAAAPKDTLAMAKMCHGGAGQGVPHWQGVGRTGQPPAHRMVRGCGEAPVSRGLLHKLIVCESKEVLCPLWRCDRRRNNLPHSS